ncbi:MAG: hypothetical protein WBZ11_04740 [Candidatus Sulfotelmatobacter sp.]|jgi:hypothetical protein
MKLTRRIVLAPRPKGQAAVTDLQIVVMDFLNLGPADMLPVWNTPP